MADLYEQALSAAWHAGVGRGFRSRPEALPSRRVRLAVETDILTGPGGGNMMGWGAWSRSMSINLMCSSIAKTETP